MKGDQRCFESWQKRGGKPGSVYPVRVRQNLEKAAVRTVRSHGARRRNDANLGSVCKMTLNHAAVYDASLFLGPLFGWLVERYMDEREYQEGLLAWQLRQSERRLRPKVKK